MENCCTGLSLYHSYVNDNKSQSGTRNLKPICFGVTAIYLLHKTCGFPLAEERKKWKKFFSHTAGSLGTDVRGVSGHMARVKFQFLFCHPPLPDMPRPPTREVLVECVQLR